MPDDSSLPDRIRINHDDYQASCIGRTASGVQFFVTEPFVPAVGDNAGCEFLAVYLFAADGTFEEARIDNLGPRSSLDKEAARQLRQSRIEELGAIHLGDIEVSPFSLERFGVTFGLVPQEPEDEEDNWWVTVEPGNYMAFYPPWDGDYDT